jgi:hypothetical protein
MTEKSKDLTGVLFKNDRKEQPNHPDRKGSALIGGVEYWVAGWLKEGKNGQFLSLAFTVKDAKPESKPAPTRGSRNENDSAW